MAVKPLSLAVFISGRGSNLQALIDACEDTNFPARIVLVFSNNPEAYGLERAQKAGIPTAIANHKDFANREEFEREILKILSRHPVDLICLAGFMRILTADFIAKCGAPIINIHPSLLPLYKGQRTHELVLQDGRAETGCTVHYVAPEVDSGPIVLQKKVSVLPGDTPETLATRVLEQEHITYPQAVRLIAEQRG